MVPAPVAVSVASAAASSARLDLMFCLAASSSCLQERSWSRCSPRPRLIPVSPDPGCPWFLVSFPVPPPIRYPGPSSTRSLSEQSRESLCRSSSLQRSRDNSLLRLRAMLPPCVLSSTSDVSRFTFESRFPLDFVLALYSSASTQTSYCERSPSIAPSHWFLCPFLFFSVEGLSFLVKELFPLVSVSFCWCGFLAEGVCTGSCLVVHRLPLGYLPGAGLLLLTVREAVLILTCDLCLDAWMRTIRWNSPRWTLVRWWPSCGL